VQGRKKVYFYITDAGGGHRGSANSLKAAIDPLGLPWDIEVINVYRTVWPAIEPGAKYFNFYGEDAYNWVLEHNLTPLAFIMRPLARLASALNRKAGARLLKDWLEKEKPDFCLSCMPFVNDIFMDAHQATGIPLSLLCTDLIDRKPYMWFSPAIVQGAAFIATGCEEAQAEARDAGAGDRSLLSGLVIHPKHTDPAAQALSQAQARQHFQLEPDLFTVLIVMGGYGGPIIKDFALGFEKEGRRWQVIACCGKNEALKAELDQCAPALHNRLVPVGFTKELHLLMRAADVTVSKPGPASLMEALAMGCPLVLDDAQTMPQEVPNARWVVDLGAAVSVRWRKDMPAAVAQLAEQPERLSAMRSAIARYPVPHAADTIVPAMAKILGSG
jgi:UDP-N-acetylglucosamine:LPS N-acetylglucosamine transferase